MKKKWLSAALALAFLFCAAVPGAAAVGETDPADTGEEAAAVETADGALRGEDTAADEEPAPTPSDEGSTEEAGAVSGGAPEEEAELQDLYPHEIDASESNIITRLTGGSVNPILNPYKVAVTLENGVTTRDSIIFPDPLVIHNDSGFPIQVSAALTVTVPEGSRVEAVSSVNDLTPGVKMFAWAEFVEDAGRGPQWDGKYGGKSSEVPGTGATVENVLTIPDGEAGYMKLCGKFTAPEFDNWTLTDTADFHVTLWYKVAPGATIRTEAPAAVPVPEPVEAPVVEPADEIAAEPVAEPADEIAAEPAAEPADEIVTEPAAEPADEIVTEPAAEPADEIAAEPAAESADEIAAESADEIVTEGAEESVPETAEEPETVPVEGFVTEIVADSAAAEESVSEPAEESQAESAEESGTIVDDSDSDIAEPDTADADADTAEAADTETAKMPDEAELFSFGPFLPEDWEMMEPDGMGGG